MNIVSIATLPTFYILVGIGTGRKLAVICERPVFICMRLEVICARGEVICARFEVVRAWFEVICEVIYTRLEVTPELSC